LITLLLGLVSTAVLGVPSAGAQTGVISGTVVAQSSRRPLAGAQVGVPGQLGKGAVTDASGRFRIAGLAGEPGSPVFLTARMIGFRATSQTAHIGAANVEFALAEQLISLDQVIITGTVGNQQARALGNSIAKINAAEVVATAAVPSVQDLINGRAPGVAVLPGTGMVGSGSKIRIRGASSFSLSGDPLIYVDGVRVDNETGSGLAVQAFGSGVVSRLNDFDPEQIESIEILKGPAAATLYGTEASNGVINIITKKGSATGTKYSFTARGGANWFQNALGRTPTNYWRDPTGNIQSVNVVRTENARGTPIWRDGKIGDYSADMSGGAGVIQYYASGGLIGEDGADPTNAHRQFSGRTNLQITPNSKFDLATSLGYVQGVTNLTCEGGCGGATWGSFFSNPANLASNCPPDAAVGCGWGRGFQSSPPEADRAMQDWQNINRFTGSATLNFKPFPWMTHRLVVGTDFTQEKNQELLPYLTNDTLRFFWGQTAAGYKYQNRREIIYNTYDYTGTIHFDLTPSINSATSFGSQYYTKHISSITAEGDFFPAPGLETVSSAATKPTTLDDFLDNNTLGYYTQQQFAWRDRLFLIGAVRVDNNSSFGKNIKWVTYPKASLSWVLSEEPFFKAHVPTFVNIFKLRTAYGQSGQQPDIFTALRTFNPVPGPNGTPALTPGTIGNPNLAPERGIETEMGFDASFLNDRLGLNFTYYHKLTKNAILLRGVAPSTGFGASSQYVNAGQILNHGIEATFNASVISRKNYGWDVNLNISHNTGLVQKLSGTDTTIVQGYTQQRVGYAPFSWFVPRVVSAQFDTATNRAINAMCDNGKGGSTPCMDANGTVIAPRVFLGRQVPAVEGSVTSGIRFLGRFRLNTMVDFKSGYKNINNDERIRCQIFRTCMENMKPQNYDPRIIAQMQSNGTLRDWVYQDARFAKLRELSLTYDASPTISRVVGARTASFTAAGRNLHTWTKYGGMDPESSFLSNNGYGLDQAELPQLTSFVFTVHLTY
jgi:TonB-linked SusC/RagA family outer membrane protein